LVNWLGATIVRMATGVMALSADLERELRAAPDAERAVNEKAYLKSDLEFIGVPFFEVGRRLRALLREQPLDHDAVVAFVSDLWERPVFELRAAAVEALTRREATLSVADLPFVERLIRDSRTWALVDGLAGDVAGAVVAREPEAAEPYLDRWAADADFWVRRSALLAELKPLRAGAPFDRFGRHADALLDEKEFFIRKAIGWVLRETGKRRPDEVIDWLAPRSQRASGVTMREAVRYLPDPWPAELIAAYKAKRPAT
jgi:3-methyladenine DNA glycosylase AlkD